jgi:hypothetical protein
MSELNPNDSQSPVAVDTPPPDAIRFAKLEGRIKTLEQRVEDLQALEGRRKQRGVYYRLVLLLLLLAAFFILRMKQGAPS